MERRKQQVVCTTRHSFRSDPFVGEKIDDFSYRMQSEVLPLVSSGAAHGSSKVVTSEAANDEMTTKYTKWAKCGGDIAPGMTSALPRRLESDILKASTLRPKF